MLCVPSSLEELLLLFAPCFSRPTFETFRAMVVGQISQTSLRTVCGMLVGSRLSGVWHHARAHRFLSGARSSVPELGLRIADLIVERLLEPGAPLIVPVNDTLAKRRETTFQPASSDHITTRPQTQTGVRSHGAATGSPPGSTSRTFDSLSGPSA